MLLPLNYNNHQKYLTQLPKIPQTITDIKTLYTPRDFYLSMIKSIADAQQRIYLVALYVEQDQGGQRILEALYTAKRNVPSLDIVVLVDWHRAQRGRIGVISDHTNAKWYRQMAQMHSDVDLPIFGVPVNTREALGVLHLKGFIIDNTVIYTGASLNDVYLHQKNNYRYDRYHFIYNPLLAETLLTYIKQKLLSAQAVTCLNNFSCSKILKIKNNARLLRQALRNSYYHHQGKATQNELSVTPLVGLGKKNPLNQTIHHLLNSTCDTLILCTPYFNLPRLLVRDLIKLLRLGKKIEIIVGDKTANDFYIPTDQPFKIIGSLPYFYEINLRNFLYRLQQYIDNGQMIIRLWKNERNSYHVKGIWIDEKWQLLTGNNFNPRSWRLDLENALLIHDPNQDLLLQREQELKHIRTYTKVIQHFTELEKIADYPVKVRKLIRRLRRIRVDRLINHLL
ncbi:phosphatidylserine/phosphatidylglycerophosphate/cardiolipin synthase [secondary endosymbiont of Heteropsylla cubana]|uniref:Phosphatidylserine/phosphatidylglycerophosphate/ cardiolipin synthase n=1 Tax=secondary endosymbiont of Heteropsylla cubana TaxID=134287 RepID=J3Z5G6_9ENTR|nr:CDP-diacylglycerol--serine O-phosphatidyltransferase [secondary endosymbiont of Heteropsylla cubana]AFP85574.1 phosphatidylserine/phosphatidylglycerophosphate/cardiolipin synthase [secondary endosymbiont of Heteropsylla cubana]